MTTARILVVDDEKDITTIVKRGLSAAGFEVDIENDPIEAFMNFRRNIYDLVILDVKMPDVNGMELYQKMYEIDNKIRVCFFTAIDSSIKDQLTKQCPQLAGDACIVAKPVNLKKLVQIIKSRLLPAQT